MESKVNLNVVVREEIENNKKIFIVNSEELGIADFGDSLDQAFDNFRKSAKDFLEVYPEKREELIKEESKVPPMLTRIFL